MSNTFILYSIRPGRLHKDPERSSSAIRFRGGGVVTVFAKLGNSAACVKTQKRWLLYGQANRPKRAIALFG
jgi:hypothetical protein